MDCCQCEGIELNFDREKAAKKLASYRTDGPKTTTRLLVKALVERGVEGQSLLDIGGGIGAVQHELLKAGVRSAVDFEASTAYIEACQEEAERQGHAERIAHHHGNFAEFDRDIAPADIVTLERVICCYPDMPLLVHQSCERTGRLLGLVFPHETWWVKIAIGLVYNLKFRLQSIPFRVYVHSTQKVDSIVRSHGFEQRFYRKTGAWQVMVYERVPSLV